MICHYRVEDKLNGYRCCHDKVKRPFVTLEYCQGCEHRDDTIRGLGDRLERAMRKFGRRRKCRGCQSFETLLNQWFPE